MGEISVAIAYDNERILELLGEIVDADKDLTLVGKANNGEDALNLIREKEPDLETRVTDMIHEIGIPAHIKGYHYLRDAIMMAIRDMDVLNAVTKVLYPTVAKNVWLYGQQRERKTHKLRVHCIDRRYDPIRI